jgi:hypothetical protein
MRSRELARDDCCHLLNSPTVALRSEINPSHSWNDGEPLTMLDAR